MALTIDLENKKAFVSGCARGIGLGIARSLADGGLRCGWMWDA